MHGDLGVLGHSHVALAFLEGVGLDGVLCALNKHLGVALDGNAVVALDGVVDRVDGQLDVVDGKVVLAADTVIGVTVYDQRAAALDGQVLGGVDTSIGLGFSRIGINVGRGIAQSIGGAVLDLDVNLIRTLDPDHRGGGVGAGEVVENQRDALCLGHLNCDLAVIQRAGDVIGAGLDDGQGSTLCANSGGIGGGVGGAVEGDVAIDQTVGGGFVVTNLAAAGSLGAAGLTGIGGAGASCQ